MSISKEIQPEDTMKLRVYKYMKTEHLAEFLQTGRLKAFRVRFSNDPMEALPLFENRKSENLWDKVMYDKMDEALCFSSKMSSPTMWGHYADSHRGVCLAFDFQIYPHYLDLDKSPNFIATARLYETISNRIFFKMLYSKSRSNVYYEASKIKDDKKLKSDITCFMTKSDEWSYESEYRMPIHKIKNIIKDNNLYFVTGLGEFLSGIILGKFCNINKNYIKSIVFHRSIKKNIQIKQAIFSLTAYTVEAHPFADTDTVKIDNFVTSIAPKPTMTSNKMKK